MRSLILIALVVAGCTTQQSRHVVDTESLRAEGPRAATVEGRLLDDFTSAENWTPYNVQGGLNPLAHEAGDGVLRVTSDSSAGLLWSAVRYDPGTEPLLAWRWRVSEVFDGSSPLSPEFDNFPARVLVGFDSGWEGASRTVLSWRRRVEEHTGLTPPARAICYTFGGSMGPHEAVDAAFGQGRIVVINLRRPNAQAGTWYSEVRDIAADYRAIFGEAPPEVMALGLGSDSHRVQRRVEAEFTNLRVYGPEAYKQFRSELTLPPQRGVPPLVLMIYGLCAGVAALSATAWLWLRMRDRAG
jgi:hypothetical protein